MAGSIKIQHGATASTPQAGFSTLWVKSSDGEFYYTKPDGSVESLVGPTGLAGPTGSAGPTGIGLGLNAKSGTDSGTGAWIPDGGVYYYDVVFDQPFVNANYTAAASWNFDTTTQNFSPAYVTNISTTGFRIPISGAGSPTVNAGVQWTAIANGETSVSYYGNFLSTVTQPNAGATAANAITYNTTDLSSGVSVVSNSRITIANAGVYNIQFSAQLQKTSGGDDQVDIWLSKNGTNVPNSNTTIMLHSNPGYEVAAWNFLVNAASGDYYQLYWSSVDTTAVLHAASAGTNPTRPAIPSVILSVTQVSTA